MARLSVAVLHAGKQADRFIEDTGSAAGKADVNIIAETGDMDRLLNVVENWIILPEVLLLDARDSTDPIQTLEMFASRFPEGEAEIIFYNVANDIETYRNLRNSGVREVFSGEPSAEDLEQVFEDIQQTALDRTGIDPRKVVYVFSACGGAGGTSLATTMARRFAREGRRTLYVDLDIATGPGSFMFNAESGARETTGLMEALSNPDRIDALFLERAIDIADKNLFYLSARRRASDPDPVSESVPVLISRAQQNFDMVVMDVPWRPDPQPDMMTVQGHCYIVAPPSPAGLLGFSILVKELEAAPARNPVFGVINRKGEFRSNDIEKASFKEVGSVEMYQIPYDSASAGRMFFEQKTYIDMSGKLRKAAEKILGTLPGKAETEKSAAPRGRTTAGRKRRLFRKRK